MSSSGAEHDATSITVLVTGGTGFIASWAIKLLLEQGYKVRATVRDVASRKCDVLRALPGADVRLELVPCNLTSPEGWSNAVNGCAYVHHIASPYSLKVNDPQRELVDPALQGTLHVLNACLKEPSVIKVILMSTMLAVSDSFDESGTRQYGPQDWNTRSSLARNPYAYSKVLAERAAHDFMKEKKPSFDLAVINPFAVLGPALDQSAPLNESMEIIASYVQGKVPFNFPGGFPMVDVRDVARAHVLAMTNPLASGGKRFLLTSGTYLGADVVQVIGEALPVEKRSVLPTKPMPWFIPKWALIGLVWLAEGRDKATMLSTMWGVLPNVDVSLAQNELGLEFTDWKTTIRDSVVWYLTEFKPPASGN